MSLLSPPGAPGGSPPPKPASSIQQGVRDEEVGTLHRCLRYGEDGVENDMHLVDMMNSPAYNMRTWAASTRLAGNVRGKKAAKRMQKWDTSYVEEDKGRKSFLKGDSSALLESRRPPQISTSQRMRETISRFKPGGAGNNAVLSVLDEQAKQHVQRCTQGSASLPFATVPCNSRTFLEEDVLKPSLAHERATTVSTALSTRELSPEAVVASTDETVLELEGTTATARTAPSPARTYAPRPRRRFLVDSYEMQMVEDGRSFNGSDTEREVNLGVSVDRLSPHDVAAEDYADELPLIHPACAHLRANGDYETVRDVELPEQQAVNYVELQREQDIVERDRAEQEEIYHGLLEDLDEHMASVKDTFSAMLTGTFRVKQTKPKRSDTSIYVTDEDFGSKSRKVAYLMASNPGFNKLPHIHGSPKSPSGKPPAGNSPQF